ncbi:MAG TPA: TatD family hydrolase [Anaerolineae bacterium]|nr:TatD family hydrolase [Anaerolineae bacterium]
MDLVDTHCHLDWKTFDPDREAVIDRAVQAGVTRMITIGVDVPSSRRAIELAEWHESVYAAVGVHPNDCAGFDAAGLSDLRSLAQHPKVIAIGEIGLDYYWHKVAPETQARTFRSQLELAAELHKPVIIHSRAAASEVLAVLEDFTRQAGSITGTLHSYFDDLTIAQRAFAIGFYLGITGPITFKKSEREREIVRQLPLDRVLLETDAPFLTPVPQRGKRNEPAYVRHVAEMVAQVRGQSGDEVARQTTRNAEQLFSLG